MLQNKLAFDTLVVVKRSGQRTEFNGEKIALAIKKAFDSVDRDYKKEDTNKVYGNVLDKIEKEYKERKTIKIEDIQDLILAELKRLNFIEVYRSFTNYREQRAASRETFVIKQQHKFLKAIESLGFGTEKNPSKTAVIEENSPSEVVYKFGTTIAEEFAKAYLLENKYVRSHDSGIIHIHDLEFLPMGTVGSIQLDLNKLLRNGFLTGYGYNNLSLDILDYMHQVTDIIEASSKDQHGPIIISAFDFFIAPSVLKSFKKVFKKQIYSSIVCQGLSDFINIEKIYKEIDKLENMDLDLALFDFAYKSSQSLKIMFETVYKMSIGETQQELEKALHYFIVKLNARYYKDCLKPISISIGLGTDTSKEGRLVSMTILTVIENMKNQSEKIGDLKIIFKVKENINFEKESKNHDVFVKASQVTLKTPQISFAFLDAYFNKKIFKDSDYKTEVIYSSGGERVAEDVTMADDSFIGGKGNLCTTSINLPRIGIKHGICLEERKKGDLNGFYGELEETMDLIKDQLLERFEIQCSKHNYNFPFLIGQGIWNDGEKVKENDRLRKILKHGTLSINITGLAETLKALFGKHHGEDEDALTIGKEIIAFMRKKTVLYSKQYNLNFTLAALDVNMERERFMNIDKAIYGKIGGITDKPCYTHSFHIPSAYHLSLNKKIVKESAFHEYTNGGHSFHIDIEKEKKSLIEIISIMNQYNIGYLYIKQENHRE